MSKIKVRVCLSCGGKMDIYSNAEGSCYLIECPKCTAQDLAEYKAAEEEEE